MLQSWNKLQTARNVYDNFKRYLLTLTATRTSTCTCTYLTYSRQQLYQLFAQQFRIRLHFSKFVFLG